MEFFKSRCFGNHLTKTKLANPMEGRNDMTEWIRWGGWEGVSFWQVAAGIGK